MFQARTDSKTAQLTVGTQSTMAGTYYFPEAQIRLGKGSDLKFGSFIAWTMQIDGASYEYISP
jgi:hypothetical protein